MTFAPNSVTPQDIAAIKKADIQEIQEFDACPCEADNVSKNNEIIAEIEKMDPKNNSEAWNDYWQLNSYMDEVRNAPTSDPDIFQKPPVFNPSSKV